MDYAALRDELQSDPEGIGYAAYLPDEPGMVVELLNKPQFLMAKTYMVTARGVISGKGLGASAGAAFLDKLETLIPVASEVKWAMRFMQGEQGIDVGDLETQITLNDLVGAAGITQAEIDGIKAMANQPASRAEILFGVNAVITIDNLREAGVI